MAGFANHALATAVTQARGLGFLGSDLDMTRLAQELKLASDILSPSTKGGDGDQELLPIGVGFLLFIAPLAPAVSVIAQFKPFAVWFFAAASLDDYTTWTNAVRAASPKTRIWIQTGSVSSALTIARTCHPDVLVMQGADAGGHGYQKTASIVSLVPETIDALALAGFGERTAVVASGGIVEERGVASALCLGAQAVVMGTRFLSSAEISLPHPSYSSAILSATDGGRATVRSQLFDELRGPNIWPIEYDGRSLVSRSYVEFEGGVGLEEVREKHRDAEKRHDRGFGDGATEERRATIWAGTGVGLVRSRLGAAEIVEEVRAGALKVINRLKV